jgi:TM2 domain-containing membrane protein YozV
MASVPPNYPPPPGDAPLDPAAVKEFAGKKVAAGILGILLGGLGIHKFILGITTPAIIMLATTLATGVIGPFLCGLPWLATSAMAIIGFIEGILYLTKSDEDFYRTYALQKKEWF